MVPFTPHRYDDVLMIVRSLQQMPLYTHVIMLMSSKAQIEGPQTVPSAKF